MKKRPNTKTAKEIIEHLLQEPYPVVPRYIVRAYNIEPASYYSFISKDFKVSEIMYCVRENRAKDETYYVIKPMEGPSERYRDYLTDKGRSLSGTGRYKEEIGFTHFTYFEKLDVPIRVQSNSQFWNDLEKAELFCNWKEGGPLAYEKNSSDNPTIGLFRVFETTLPFNKLTDHIKWPSYPIFGDISKNCRLISSPLIQDALPILSDTDFVKKKDKIIEVINRYL